MRRLILLVLLSVGWMAPAGGQDLLSGAKRVPPNARTSVAPTATPVWKGQVLNWYPHDIWAFTEGLLLNNGDLYESTGFSGASSVRRVHLATGLVTRGLPLGPLDFGEGLANVGGYLVQLTYRQQKAYVYDLQSFQRVGEFSYPGEGWGLCSDGQRLVMSNGSNVLTVRDPKTFAELSTISVTLDSKPQDQLNELECVGDKIYANVFGTNHILEIGQDGVVTKVIDLAGLLNSDEQGCLGSGLPGAQHEAVLNGIAYDPADGTFLVTGKLWPKVFRVRFVPS
jgi:glutaminyl-peptide cyclotransferase